MYPRKKKTRVTWSGQRLWGRLKSVEEWLGEESARRNFDVQQELMKLFSSNTIAVTIVSRSGLCLRLVYRLFKLFAHLVEFRAACLGLKKNNECVLHNRIVQKRLCLRDFYSCVREASPTLDSNSAFSRFYLQQLNCRRTSPCICPHCHKIALALWRKI